MLGAINLTPSPRTIHFAAPPSPIKPTSLKGQSTAFDGMDIVVLPAAEAQYQRARDLVVFATVVPPQALTLSIPRPSTAQSA